MAYPRNTASLFGTPLRGHGANNAGGSPGSPARPPAEQRAAEDRLVVGRQARRIEIAEGDIARLKARVRELEGTILLLETEKEKARGRIGRLTEQHRAVGGALQEARLRVAEVQRELAQAKAATADGSLWEAADRARALQAQVSGLEAAVEAQGARVVELELRLAEAQGKLQEQEGEDDAGPHLGGKKLKAQVKQQAQDLEDLERRLAEAQRRLRVVEERHQALEVRHRDSQVFHENKLERTEAGHRAAVAVLQRRIIELQADAEEARRRQAATASEAAQVARVSAQALKAATEKLVQEQAAHAKTEKLASDNQAKTDELQKALEANQQSIAKLVGDRKPLEEAVAKIQAEVDEQQKALSESQKSIPTLEAAINRLSSRVTPATDPHGAPPPSSAGFADDDDASGAEKLMVAMTEKLKLELRKQKEFARSVALRGTDAALAEANAKLEEENESLKKEVLRAHKDLLNVQEGVRAAQGFVAQISGASRKVHESAKPQPIAWRVLGQRETRMPKALEELDQRVRAASDALAIALRGAPGGAPAAPPGAATRPPSSPDCTAVRDGWHALF